MILHGKTAVRKVSQKENRQLSYEEIRVVMLEGYATTPYRCSNDVLTIGVGQTGKWINRTFKESFEYHVQRVTKRFPDLHNYPQFLRAELIQAEYRGDLGLSPKACQLIKEGNWFAAATEFLDHKEYKKTQFMQIKRRIAAVSHALNLMGCQQ